MPMSSRPAIISVASSLLKSFIVDSCVGKRKGMSMMFRVGWNPPYLEVGRSTISTVFICWDSIISEAEPNCWLG